MMNKIFLIFIAICLCSCQGEKMNGLNKGAYYQDDGPHSKINIDFDKIKNAVPKKEPIYENTKKPYKVLGKRYVPMTKILPFKEKGLASWYGKKYHGNNTSIGEVYDMYQMTGAHKTLPLPSYVKVKNLKNKKEVIIRLNDRGPFLKGRIIDLSYAAAHKIDIIEKGSELVEIELIDPNLIKAIEKKFTNKYLQVGVFKDFTNSKMLLNKLENLNYLKKIDKKIIQQNSSYKVLVGPFSNLEALNLVHTKLENILNSKILIKSYGE